MSEFVGQRQVYPVHVLGGGFETRRADIDRCFREWNPWPTAAERFREEFGRDANAHWFGGPSNLEMAGLANLLGLEIQAATGDLRQAMNRQVLHGINENASPYWRTTVPPWWRRVWRKVRDLC